MLTKREIIAYTKRLDKIATEVQGNWNSYGLSKKAAYDFCLHVDSLSDRLERLVGLDRQAKTLETQPDEPYMDQFNQHGVQDGEGDTDEPYMDHMKKDPHGQFHEETLEGEPQSELSNTKSASWYRFADDADEEEKKEEEKKEASTDYWGESKTSSTDDYWNDSKVAGKDSDDYWG